MVKNNFTFGYVLFVGVPLLILIGTLRAGADLSAPPAVSGDWTVEPAPNKCAESLANASQPALSIYQTGSNLLIAFNDPRKTTLAQVRHEIGDFEFFRPDGCRQVLWPQGEFSRTAM